MPMRKKFAVILYLILSLSVNGSAGTSIKTEVVTVSVGQQYDSVQPGGESALAVHFDLKKDWHFYASAKTAPGGMNLKITPASKGQIKFAAPVFPKGHLYFDKSSNQKLDVFSDGFTVYLPFSIGQSESARQLDVKIDIDGAVCSDVQCRVPNFDGLIAQIKIDPNAPMAKANFTLPSPVESKPAAVSHAGYSTLVALLLAFLAGLSLNIMPCVWPVLPLIVMRIVEQAKQSSTKSISLGFTFCLGILLFFASLAAANIILQLFYGTVLQWGDQFREPVFVTAMALLLVVLALFMFNVFSFVVPSSIASKSPAGKGYLGAVGMGFLAAVLSTPCSFAVLAAAFAWAQAQPLVPATVAIMTIGIGMATPYAILISVPGLLKSIPKPGQWMELFKQTIGFILLLIAVKLIVSLPQTQRADVLYFAVALAFCVWMWGSWVGYNTKPSRKWLIRIIAVILAVTAGRFLLSAAPAEKQIDWQEYNTNLIEKTKIAGQPVLIKFTADWCLSCQLVEKTVYGHADIAKLIKQKNVLAIKADTTTKDMPATYALKNIYNEPGVPISILFIPGQNDAIRWRSLTFADQLKKFLEKLPSR